MGTDFPEKSCANKKKQTVSVSVGNDHGQANRSLPKIVHDRGVQG
jgi:hypothetical protein